MILTPNSSYNSLARESSSVSHVSTFHPGNVQKSHLVSNNVRYLHCSSLMIAFVVCINPSSVCSCFSFADNAILNLIVIAGSCLSLYPSLTSEFDKVVAQLGHIRWTLNHLYTRFWLYIFWITRMTDSI